MKQRHRICFLFLALLLLVAVGRGQTGSYSFLTGDFWFSSGLLLVILLALVDQPHFSRDANILVNGVTGLATLFAVTVGARDFFWWLFLGFCAYLVVSSAVIVMVRADALHRERPWLQLSSRVNRTIGRPEAIFSAFFLWGIYKAFSPESGAYRYLLLYWSIFMILNLPAVGDAIGTAIEARTGGNAPERLGVVRSLTSPGIIDGHLQPAAPALAVGDTLEVRVPGGALAATASVLEDRILAGYRHVRLVVRELHPAWSSLADGGAAQACYLELPNPGSPDLRRPIGVVGRGTEIQSVVFRVGSGVPLEQGIVLEVAGLNGSLGYYQVISARVAEEAMAEQQCLQYVEVTASQLGKWNSQQGDFEAIPWLAEPGAVAFEVCEADIIAPPLPKGRLDVGSVPGSPFRVSVGVEELVTHNAAILGVTGSGKSYLAFHLIAGVLEANIRVLVLDISRQYWGQLGHLNPQQIKQPNEIDDWMKGQQRLGIYQFAEAENFPQRTAEMLERVFAGVSKTALKAGVNEPARILVVLEEAHSLVPEWNQVSTRGDEQHVNKTSRIVLQGRKFGMGVLLITQRTANVTKTILNQCTTMFALQCFDQTGLDFLRNYIGDSYANAISNLRRQHAVAVGRAISSSRPVIIRIPDLKVAAETGTSSPEPPAESQAPTADPSPSAC